MACQPAGLCTPDALRTALAAAAPGAVVDVGACRIEGSFVVPGGVTLRGVGAQSILASGASDAPVLDVQVGGASTHLSGLSLAVDGGGTGIAATSGGTLEVESVTVGVTRGTAVAVRDGAATFEDVRLRGPMTAESAPTAPRSVTETGAWGVVARDANITLRNVRARDFAVGAIALVGGTLAWIDTDDALDLEGNRGTGLSLFGVTAFLDGVEFGAMRSGIALPGVLIAAVASEDGANTALVARDARLTGGAGYGVFAQDAAVSLERVRVESVGLIGVQQQRGSFTGTDLVVRDNGGAGLALLDLTAATIERADVSAQRRVAIPVDVGSAMLADGIQVRRSGLTAAPIDLTLRTVTMTDNPRIGLLLDAAGDAPRTLGLESVQVRADAAGALGVVAQRTVVPGSWDAQVTRGGVTQTNDANVSGPLELVGLVMPPAFPPPL